MTNNDTNTPSLEQDLDNPRQIEKEQVTQENIAPKYINPLSKPLATPLSYIRDHEEKLQYIVKEGQWVSEKVDDYFNKFCDNVYSSGDSLATAMNSVYAGVGAFASGVAVRAASHIVVRGCVVGGWIVGGAYAASLVKKWDLGDKTAIHARKLKSDLLVKIGYLKNKDIESIKDELTAENIELPQTQASEQYLSEPNNGQIPTLSDVEILNKNNNDEKVTGVRLTPLNHSLVPFPINGTDQFFMGNNTNLSDNPDDTYIYN